MKLGELSKFKLNPQGYFLISRDSEENMLLKYLVFLLYLYIMSIRFHITN